MKITKSQLKQIIQEELREVVRALDGVEPEDVKTQFDTLKKQQALRQKADEEVDFGKWEQQVDKATDDLEAAFLALERPLLAQDQEGIAAAREKIQQARVNFRKQISRTSRMVFMFYSTLKNLGGTLSQEEEEMVRKAVDILKQKQKTQKQMKGTGPGGSLTHADLGVKEPAL